MRNKPPVQPKLGALIVIVDGILAEDKALTSTSTGTVPSCFCCSSRFCSTCSSSCVRADYDGSRLLALGSWKNRTHPAKATPNACVSISAPRFH